MTMSWGLVEQIIVDPSKEVLCMWLLKGMRVGYKRLWRELSDKMLSENSTAVESVVK